MADEDGLRVRLQHQRGSFQLDVDLRLPGRGVSVLFGPSGCGKTTLLRGIAGLERAMQGEVSVNGEIWLGEGRPSVVPTSKRALGFVFQDAALFPHLRVLENLRYGLCRAPREPLRFPFDETVALLELTPLLDRYPGHLSGGEKQRVAMARALLAQPRLLLMDEPMASLDARRKAELLPFLERIREEVAIPMVYVTHAAEELWRLADFVALMAEGRVWAAGSLPGLLPELAHLPGFGNEAGTLIVGRISAHHLDDGLSEVEFDGGRLWFPRLSRAIGSQVRCRIAPTDVSLSLEEPRLSSALNRLGVTVEGLTEERSGSTVLVHLRLGRVMILSRVTLKSVRELKIQPGQVLCAEIKATTLGR